MRNTYVLLLICLLSACGATTQQISQPTVVGGYVNEDGKQEGGLLLVDDRCGGVGGTVYRHIQVTNDGGGFTAPSQSALTESEICARNNGDGTASIGAQTVTNRGYVGGPSGADRITTFVGAAMGAGAQVGSALVLKDGSGNGGPLAIAYGANALAGAAADAASNVDVGSGCPSGNCGGGHTGH